MSEKMEVQLDRNSFVRLSNQVKMPRIGFGSGIFVPWTANQVKIFQCAIDNGYRLFDVASIYYTEGGLGKAISECGIPRDEFFISSKLWNLSMRRGKIAMIREFEETLRRLKTDYLDLYLFHWPTQGSYLEAWEFMEGLYYSGRVRAIGACNITRQHLMELANRGEVLPHVHQNEFHPFHTNDYSALCARDLGIHYEGVFLFARGGTYLHNTILEKIARKYGRNIFQIILRWGLQRGVTVVPGSTNPEHIRSNIEVYDFELGAEDMDQVNSMNVGKTWLMSREMFTD